MSTKIIKELSRLRNFDGKPPTVFVRESGKIIVSAEDGNGWADYYGEFRGGFPWIHPDLEKFAQDRGMFWEWENPGAIILTS